MSIPYLFILFRFCLIPVHFVLAYFHLVECLVLSMYLGLISDIFDGIIARKQGLSTEKMRRLDSQTDMLFWLSLGFSLWFLFPRIIQEQQFAIWCILGMEIACYAISIIRFKRETCTHAYLSKLWGLSLLAGFTEAFLSGSSGFFFHLAIILGLISHIDRILITLILKEWTFDVPSFYHAILIRKNRGFKKFTIFH